MQGYIGEIRMFAGNYAPAGWALCAGQELPVSNYTTLYSLIGTMYGGDGVNTFAVPNLQSRVPISPGQGPGLPMYVTGEIGGTEINILTPLAIGMHSHAITGSAGIFVSGEDGHQVTPINNYPAANGDNIYATTSNTVMAPANINLTTGLAGSALPEPITNIQPYLAINYIICLEGIVAPPAN